MIPGVGKAIRDVDIDDNAFKGIEAIIQSMTPKERTNPEILNNSASAYCKRVRYQYTRGK